MQERTQKTSKNSCSPGRTAFFLFAILVLGLGVRIFYLMEIAEYPNFLVPYPGMDFSVYHGLAKQVAAGDILLGNDVYYMPPLYIYVLGGLYSLLGDSFWVARLANIALGLGSIVLIYLFSLRLFKSTTIALLAGLGASIYGPLIVFDTSGLKTGLSQFLIALLLFLLSRIDHKEKTVLWLFTGLTAGLAFGIKGQVGIFLAAVCLWTAAGRPFLQTLQTTDFARQSVRGRVRNVSLLMLGIFLAIAPFAMRNHYVAKDLVHSSSTSGIHFYIGNHEKALGRYTRVSGIRPNPAGHFYDARQLAEKETGQVMSASETSAFWKSKAFEFAKENPGKFIALMWKKSLLLFSAYEIPNNDNYQYLTQRSLFLSFLPGIGLLLPFGLCGILLSFPAYLPAGMAGRQAGPEHRRFALLHIFFFTYAAAVVLTFVTWRYRLPITLALLPFAGYFLVTAGGYIRKRQFKSLVLCVFLLITCWGITQASPVKKQFYEIDIKRAEAKMKMSDRELIILKQLESASDLSDKDTGRLLFELADLRHKQFDIEGAIPILQKALALDPHQHRQWRTLSNMLRQLGHIEQAKKAKENARKYKQRRSPERHSR